MRSRGDVSNFTAVQNITSEKASLCCCIPCFRMQFYLHLSEPWNESDRIHTLCVRSWSCVSRKHYVLVSTDYLVVLLSCVSGFHHPYRCHYYPKSSTLLPTKLDYHDTVMIHISYLTNSRLCTGSQVVKQVQTQTTAGVACSMEMDAGGMESLDGVMSTSS